MMVKYGLNPPGAWPALQTQSIAHVLDMTDAHAPSPHPPVLPGCASEHGDPAASTDLLTRLSHEIRTPLNTIVGFADLLHLYDVSLSERERQEALDGLIRSARHLTRLTDRAFQLAQLDADQVRLHNQPCDLVELVRTALDRMAPWAQAKGLAVTLRLRGRLPKEVTLDPDRLHELLGYLLENAVKFTEVGEVRIVARVVPRTAQHSELIIKVLDTGIGIAPALARRVFDPFVREDQTSSRQYPGLGLGLAIGERLARLMAGVLKVRSSPGYGSAFTLTLPIPRPAEDHCIDPVQAAPSARVSPLPQTATPVDLHGRRVLVAEDGPDNQRLISFVLQRGGAVVTMAENGREALTLALRQRDSGAPYDVILMDMHMPVLDGYTATQQLRQAGYRGPVIALTANTGPHERLRCLACGCDEYLTKPVISETLFRTIREHLR